MQPAAGMPEITGGVLSILIVTETEAVKPAPFVALQVKIVPAVSAVIRVSCNASVCGLGRGRICKPGREWTAVIGDVHGEVLDASTDNRVGPTHYQPAFTMYMNRVVELGWLVLRLLPYLQLERGAFGSDWHRKYAVLDNSFRYMVQGLSNMGKKIADAFMILVDQKFSFPDLCYFDPDGAA